MKALSYPATATSNEVATRALACLACSAALAGLSAHAQAPAAASVIQVPPVAAHPIAVVALDSRVPGSAAMVTGALQVMNGKAIIASNGTVTAGASTTEVDLPQRGTLNVCASTTVKLAADASVPSGETPGILMAMDHGAIEASFATSRNADIVLTPDFRILIGAPGMAHLKVRLGQAGDTCVDNPGSDAPYVLVTSVFDGSVYRVQPGQRVMFQHGSLQEVVDQEKEPCGCPPSEVQGNDFPLAQSAGLAPLQPTKAAPAHAAQAAPPTQALVFNAGAPAPSQAPQAASAPIATAPATDFPPHHKGPGFFGRIGRFFRRLFGAD